MEEVTFPNEIWLDIFKRIERRNLMKLRLVCHRFYDLIEPLLDMSPEWRGLTCSSNLYASLEMNMQRSYPYVLVTHWMDIDDPVLWRGTYLSCQKWQKVLVYPHTKDTIAPKINSGHISCICTFDKYIAIAFDSGLIANYTFDNISQPFYIADHGTRIFQVEFWYSNGDVLVVSVGDDCALKFWDVQNKIEIATNGFFANYISYGECRHFCIGDMGGILTSYARVGNHISPGPTLNLELRDDQQLIEHIVKGKNLIVIVRVKSEILLKWIALIEGGKLIDSTMFWHSFWTVKSGFIVPLERSIMATNIGITSYIRIVVSSPESKASYYYRRMWYEINSGEHFGCNVTSIALHDRILMLGLEDGSLHLLRIPNKKSYLIDLEQHIKDSKKIKVDTEPILSLTVLEVDLKPCIVAATKQKVHLINFF